MTSTVTPRSTQSPRGADRTPARGVWLNQQGVARHLGISTRTLQRRLGEEGATFQQLLADLRGQLAHHYLTQSTYSLAEIAFLLGYDNQTPFTGRSTSGPAKPPGRQSHCHLLTRDPFREHVV